MRLTACCAFSIAMVALPFKAAAIAQTRPALTEANTVSVSQALSLPVDELAHHGLGAVGDIVMDVDRPSWGPNPLVVEWPPKGRPPMNELRFYGRPSGGFAGLCSADWITVQFDDDMKLSADQGLRVKGINAETRYGVGGRIDPPYGAASTDVDGDVAARCRGATSRDYFPAPDFWTAHTIALFVERISYEAKAGGSLSFSVSCSPEAYGRCKSPGKILQSLDVRDIQASEKTDCSKDAPKIADCYKLTMKPDHILNAVWLVWRIEITGWTRYNTIAIYSVVLRPQVVLSR